MSRAHLVANALVRFLAINVEIHQRHVFRLLRRSDIEYGWQRGGFHDESAHSSEPDMRLESRDVAIVSGHPFCVVHTRQKLCERPQSIARTFGVAEERGTGCVARHARLVDLQNGKFKGVIQNEDSRVL